MEPNDLRRAMENAEEGRRAMGVLTARADAIMDIYKNAVQNFMADPMRYDGEFNVRGMSMRPRWQQEEYYGGVAKSLLICATQAILAAETFHISQRIKAAKKAGRKDGFKIEGVTLPDLSNTRQDLESLCQCGHAYGYHTIEDKGFCLGIECDCQGFKLTEGVKQ